MPLAADLLEPIHVFSDLHLGHPVSYLTHASMLAPLLDGAKTAIFNGDSFEQLNIRHCTSSGDRWRELADECYNRGVQPIFVTGNHDPAVSNLHYVKLYEERLLITHGDAFHPAIAPWAKEGPMMLGERRRLLAGQSQPTTLDEEMALTKRTALVASLYDEGGQKGGKARFRLVSKFARQPVRAINAMRYWAAVPGYFANFCARFAPNTAIGLFGHSHRAGVWQRSYQVGNREKQTLTVINTGSYGPLSNAQCVVIEDAVVRVYKVVRSGELFQRGRLVWQSLSLMPKSPNEIGPR